MANRTDKEAAAVHGTNPQVRAHQGHTGAQRQLWLQWQTSADRSHGRRP